MLTTTSKVGVPVDVTQDMMGEEGYVSAEYRRLEDDPETMARMYKQGELYPGLFSNETEIHGFREEPKGLRQQVQDLRKTAATGRENLANKHQYEVESEELLNVLIACPT